MQSHQIQLTLRDELPEQIEVDVDLTITVRATCSAGCDLRGGRIRLVAGEQTLRTVGLTSFDEGVCETEPLVIRTPDRVGEHDFDLVFTDRDQADTNHDEEHLPFTLRTRAHGTSLAVWGLPAGVTFGERLTVKVGARCSAGCDLGGREVTIHDGAGEPVASARLGESPWPGTSALYWAEAELAAPEREGVTSWSASFAPTELPTPHDEASASLGVMVTRPPEYRLSVRVVDGSTGEPLADARVLAPPYRGATDASGTATIGVTGGTFELVVRKVGYIDQTRSVDVAGDTALAIEIHPEPVKTELDEYM